jgi:serine/threonine-protein kinase
MLALVLLEQKRAQEALAEANAESAEWARLWSLGIVCWRLGKHAESNEALAELERKYADSSAFQVAQVRAVRGEVDAAFEWLERAYEARDAGIGLAQVSPALRPLHGDPRWAAFMRQIGLER